MYEVGSAEWASVVLDVACQLKAAGWDSETAVLLARDWSFDMAWEGN